MNKYLEKLAQSQYYDNYYAQQQLPSAGGLKNVLAPVGGAAIGAFATRHLGTGEMFAMDAARKVSTSRAQKLQKDMSNIIEKGGTVPSKMEADFKSATSNLAKDDLKYNKAAVKARAPKAAAMLGGAYLASKLFT